MNALAALPVNDGHVPVMLAEVLASLSPRDGGRYLDGTFGGGGYARAILQSAECTLHGIDRDPDAIIRGEEMARQADGRLIMHQGTFGAMETLVEEFVPFDGIVLDLGVSSFQIDQAERGFSFRHDGPLDMRMGGNGVSAADIVNGESEQTIADILYRYGEEKLSRRIARAIVNARAEETITTTGYLARIIRSCVPRDRSGIDPATRSFQGLRIAVNDELGELERALEAAPRLLAPGGVFTVVTFHSLEDRMVKRAMAVHAGRTGNPSRYEPIPLHQNKPDFDLLHSRPQSATDEEARENPRARSARLRALVRTPAAATSVSGTSA
ncbi:16S rRNA (cytosine(1402)-N(4))-methyltransferase RsmH [Gluconobacter wancherniae]|uniref:Ribosomal RNA small subunit methyltransferase H n=1 Tax=Gluconobacter wancherniae NBRC 103581 TaxID=656744 RepID=A0A511AZC9_9PROT|nr:16S rRNA (cytosine(1402)-N(4))-methyltransferase RsmH [Gluconobacter wancherniae]MBF0853718.1 16S rRNA (cytosine(1402)-N(4))-methyltransferase RsmH [Gluconobacter wancherniae]MBS1088917.1 16S rRNA (cytosine(1402)-N(4))-methyltransferase RsmH [Gluconobacter wancherniae]MBS1094193.1 16S rRNA (cytosine(1402)-N(4))-methyltransferase RsmH [Gluconobacter wancherniae]GBD55533.1 ribosomal RNA small subunit methyltransferase H [Gluconobacter wancherniae NBRC 103581]GBR66595.1 S-adenosyl-methyltransf